MSDLRDEWLSRTKPCKFCGGEPWCEVAPVYEPDFYLRQVVECSKCSAFTIGDTADEAETLWNEGKAQQNTDGWPDPPNASSTDRQE